MFEPLEYHFLHRLLFEEKARLEEDAILKIAHDVANAMQYVHNMGFLHCYLGAQSVIVTRDHTAKVHADILLQSVNQPMIEILASNYNPKTTDRVMVSKFLIKNNVLYSTEILNLVGQFSPASS